MLLNVIIFIFACCYPLKVVSNDCQSSFSYPSGCSGATCIYVARWNVRPDKTVEFTVNNTVRPNSWVAIGFSETGDMIGSDVVMFTSNPDKVWDKHVNQYRWVLDDDHQDLLSWNVKHTDNIIEMSFTRNLDTKDIHQDVSLNQCVYFLYPDKPGQVLPNGDITMHEDIPIRSDQKICLDKC